MLETLQNRVVHLRRSEKVNAAYLIYQEGSRRVYVGSSGQPGLRTSNHMWLLKRNEHSNSTFQELYNENPNFYVVYYTVNTRDEAFELEQALIDYYSPSGLLINHALNALIPNKGIKRSDETRAKLRLAHLGFRHTPEAKEKIRLAGIGRTKSEAERQHLSVIKKGKPQPDHIAEMCRERNRLRSKPVSIDGAIYPSVREASRALNIPRDTVKTRLRKSDAKWSAWFFV